MPCERQRLDMAFDRVAFARPSALTPKNQKTCPDPGLECVHALPIIHLT
jgi:hypothetical protein